MSVAPAKRLDLVTFDLDGTLIDGTAFLLVARHFGFEEEVLFHDQRFRSGEITLEECFKIEFAFLKGKTVGDVHQALAAGTWFDGIRDAVGRLRDAGIRVAVLTDNPDFVTSYLGDRFGITEHIASRGETIDGIVTGNVHARFDKWANLHDFLARQGIPSGRVAHIGNDVNDVNVWKHIALGVCVEPTSQAVADAADIVIPRLRSHIEVADAILAWDAAGRAARDATGEATADAVGDAPADPPV